MGWIFQGSPKKFDIDDYLSRYPERIYWRTPQYASNIAIGDRAFIWRSGTESGAIAIGTVVETAKPASEVKHPEAIGDDLWIAEKPDPTEPKTGIHIEELRLSLEEGMIDRNVVKNDKNLDSLTLIRMPNSTVFRLSEDETKAMERLWGIVVSLAHDSSDEEGGLKLRSHYVRERSQKLRSKKLHAFREENGRLYCELCKAKEDLYPSEFCERVFEIHHRAPLSTAATPVRTTLNDLAILCANCHRSIHATNAVDANFKLLSDFFSTRNI